MFIIITSNEASQFEDFLTVKLRWLEIFQQEDEDRDCPKQIVLGSPASQLPHQALCFLGGISVLPEKQLRDSKRTTSQWLFAKDVADESNRSKEQDKGGT